MENLTFEGEEKLPRVDFDSQTGILTLYGRCVPEDSVSFFEPLMKWIDEYGKSPRTETIVDIYLDYFNTSSSKLILNLFEKVKEMDVAGTSKVKVIWRCDEDDADLLEAGEDYSAIVNIPFEIVKMVEE